MCIRKRQEWSGENFSLEGCRQPTGLQSVEKEVGADCSTDFKIGNLNGIVVYWTISIANSPLRSPKLQIQPIK